MRSQKRRAVAAGAKIRDRILRERMRIAAGAAPEPRKADSHSGRARCVLSLRPLTTDLTSAKGPKVLTGYRARTPCPIGSASLATAIAECGGWLPYPGRTLGAWIAGARKQPHQRM